MYKGLQWLLGVTVLLAVWAQWWPRPQPLLVSAVAHRTAKPDAPPAAAVGKTTDKLPDDTAWQPWALEPARRDPFIALVVPVRPLAPPPQPMAPPPPMPVATLPPPQPTAPPATALRYLGVLFNPTGERLLLLADGEAVVTATVGTALPNGFVVQSVANDAVRLAHAPTGTAIDVPLPSVARSQP